MLPTRLFDLVEELRARPNEAEWFEFKVDNYNPERIAQNVSSLANAARLLDRDLAYIVWGVKDETHEIIGSTFRPEASKQGSQLLPIWLTQVLSPCPNLCFHEFDHPDGRLVVLEIPAATFSPVTFNGEAYIRIGSASTKLTRVPEVQAALWAKLRPFAWEKGVAKSYVTGDEVLLLIDYSAYFELTRQPLPDNRGGIFERLEADHLIRTDVGGRWDILNLGAILFARQLTTFVGLERKAVRIIEYAGSDRITTRRRQDVARGYAAGFTGLIDFMDSLTPKTEVIGKALREELAMYPAIAIRELIANCLIHQDLTVTGAGPMVEVFSDRIEITNPGKPLVEPDRFIDLPPRSRNESLAALMRRMRICEEQGSGVDKAVSAVEAYQLPPPDFRMDGDSVRVVLYGPRSFGDMTPVERIRACWQHAALRYLAGHKMTNASLRERFGLEKTSAASTSRVIRDTVDAGVIRLADTLAPKSGYVPAWA